MCARNEAGSKQERDKMLPQKGSIHCRRGKICISSNSADVKLIRKRASPMVSCCSSPNADFETFCIPTMILMLFAPVGAFSVPCAPAQDEYHRRRLARLSEPGSSKRRACKCICAASVQECITPSHTMWPRPQGSLPEPCSCVQQAVFCRGLGRGVMG